MLKKQANSIIETAVQRQPFIHKKRTVGILGGGFNPVHMGHLIMADQVLHQLGLDEFYLMPSYESPHVDKKEVIDGHHRVEMLKLAVDSNPDLNLELTEIHRKGKSYTYDTMKQLIENNPETMYYLVIGGDMVEYLPTWYRIDELMEMVQFVAIKREGFKAESPYPLIWIDAPLIDISSTMIRQKIRSQCSVKYLLPDNVIDYISKEGLYQDDL